MIKDIICPLCNSDKIKYIDKINKIELIKLYYKLTKVDFSYLICNELNYYECLKCGIRFYYPHITGDEVFYNALQKIDWYYMNEKNEYNYARKYINNGDKVLEIGCGKGAFASYIPDNKYIGLDSSKNAKIMAAENGIFIENDIIENYSKFHKEEFDVVVSFQVLEHVDNPKTFIESSLNALKVNGRLIIGVPSENSFLKYVTNDILNMPPHHITRWSDQTFLFIAEKYNLDILDIYHEKVQEIHKLYYLNTLVRNSLRSCKLIDTSLTGKFINKMSGLVARLLIKGLRDEMLPNGHTVVVVFQKRG